MPGRWQNWCLDTEEEDEEGESGTRLLVVRRSLTFWHLQAGGKSAAGRGWRQSVEVRCCCLKAGGPWCGPPAGAGPTTRAVFLWLRDIRWSRWPRPSSRCCCRPTTWTRSCRTRIQLSVQQLSIFVTHICLYQHQHKQLWTWSPSARTGRGR